MIKAKYLNEMCIDEIYFNCLLMNWLNTVVNWCIAFSNASSRVSNLNSRYSATTAGKQ